MYTFKKTKQSIILWKYYSLSSTINSCTQIYLWEFARSLATMAWDNLKLTDILQMTQIFWESVTLFIEIFTQTKYQNNRTFGKTFLTINTTNLTKWIRKKCEGLLTEKECLEAVKSMVNHLVQTVSLSNLIKFSGEMYHLFL